MEEVIKTRGPRSKILPPRADVVLAGCHHRMADEDSDANGAASMSRVHNCYDH
jgi:hypothetical protein